VVGIISTLGARAAAVIMLALARLAMLFARTAWSEFGTARGGAGAQDPSRTTGLLSGYRARMGIRMDQAYSDLGAGVGRPLVAGAPD
jgi:hypothetical protein